MNPASSLTWGKAILVTALALAGVFLFQPDAMAQAVNTQILNSATSRVQAVYQQVSIVVWYIGAFGVIVMAILAFFGRFPWTRFFALAGGLFLIAFIQQLIQFLGGTGF